MALLAIKISQIVRLRDLVCRWKAKSLTPSGFLAVYVGPDRARFVIPTRFINFPVFVALLRQAEEEFGYQISGGLGLPCDPAFFRQVLLLLDQDEERFRGWGMEDFIVLNQASCRETSSTTSSHAFTPLLPKTRV